jgi:hypothetical protein
MADTKVSDLTEISVPALADWTYWVDDPAGTPASASISGNRLGGLLVPQVCQGRLTLETGVPVSTTDQTAKSTLYWSPCTPGGASVTSGLVGFYDGTRYVILSLTELSCDLDTAEGGGQIDSGKNYDVFIDYNGGTPALVLGDAWTNDTTRATALAKQGSLVVLTGSTDWRWVGTIRGSAAGDTEDSVTKRFVWNAYNAVSRRLQKTDTTASWTYNSTTIRQARAESTNQVEIVCGAAVSALKLMLGSTCSGEGVSIQAGIGEDSTTALAAECAAGNYSAWTASGGLTVGASYNHLFKIAPLGYHYYAWLENVTNNTIVATCYGDDTAALRRCGLIGEFEC